MAGRYFLLTFVAAAFLTVAFSLDFSENINSDTVSGSSPLRERLQKQVPIWMERYNIPGLVLGVVKDGEISWQEAFGYADLTGLRPMEVNSICRVESISKSVTAWGVMRLVEKGAIALDTSVAHYLRSWSFPESDYPVEEITVRHLLSNNSGLPLGTIGERYAPLAPKPTLKERLSKEAIMQNKPGASFSYSNTGFNLLELLIEDVTGREFSEYMKEEVLLPLEMYQASFDWQDDFPTPVPLGYDTQGNPIPVYVYPDKASGGLFATVEDIAHFVIGGMPNFSSQGMAVLSRQGMEMMFTSQVEPGGFYGLAFDGYGFGHFIEELSTGEKALAHGGQGSGWMTHFHMVPQTGDGIVILTNSQRSWPLFSLLLSEWAEDCGFAGIGMGIIKQAKTGLSVMIGLCVLLTLFALWKWWRAFSAGRRIFAPMTDWNRLPRILQGTFFMLLLFLLIWALSQPYLFLTSIFPISSIYLGICAIGIIITLLFHVLFPKIKPVSEHGDN